jgi:hypothetical protein
MTIDKVNFIFQLFKDYIVETDIIGNDNIIQLEIYKDDITEYTVIPYLYLKEIEKHYNIISLIPQIKTIEGETFASLIIEIKEI